MAISLQKYNMQPLRVGLPTQYAVPLRVGLPIQYIMQYDTVRNAKTSNTTLWQKTRIHNQMHTVTAELLKSKGDDKCT